MYVFVKVPDKRGKEARHWRRGEWMEKARITLFGAVDASAL